jgi:glycine hydroxymethyltransferase
MNKISQLTQDEVIRQRDTLNLIASENYPSPKVLQLLGSVWSNKYGEGYPGKRYYAGNQLTDELETFVQQKALQVFDKTNEYGVNVQVLSGSPANAMVYLSVLNYGDTIMSLNVANGGHISHLHPTSNWNKFFKLTNYDVKEISPSNFEIDLESYSQKLLEIKPKLVIIGFSAYPKKYEFKQMCKLAHEVGAFVLADIAHINGLVAAGLHATPFGSGQESADFVSMTTHKTFRGPRGAMVFAKNNIPEYLNHHFETLVKQPKSLIEIINKTVFPGTSGGPHFNQIAAVGQACLEILGEENYPDGCDFSDYSQTVLTNCKTLETTFEKEGLEVVSPTQNHLCLVKLPAISDSLDIQHKLEKIGIITNRNSVPFDQKSPWRPSGMRFGTAALTSRGLTTDMAKNLGKLIADCIFDRTSQTQQQAKVKELVDSLSWWY